ncbi:hypothetical protein ABZT17_18150 [Streptomyces sp. NPDC005648]|uniref:hypothetical protein n=1 Tax=Streptomyces sp. NPDC005648 TaxID=3157044 RepID=UPI0033BDB44C
MHEEWFEVDDVEVDDRQKSFLAAVRPYAQDWPECRPAQTAVIVYEPGEDLEEEAEDDEGELQLIVDVSGVGKRVLLTVGAFLVGDRLSCSEVHNQTYAPQESSTVQAIEASGSPAELGRIAADWFGEILRRPVITPADRKGWSFVHPGSELPDGYSWLRNAPSSTSNSPS